MRDGNQLTLLHVAFLAFLLDDLNWVFKGVKVAKGLAQQIGCQASLSELGLDGGSSVATRLC